MRDGVRLAVDVSLPGSGKKGEATSKERKIPAIFIQCRYMRNITLRWPFSLTTGGLPVDLITQDLKSTLIAGCYGIVSADVRGTGTHFCPQPLAIECLQIRAWLSAAN